MISAIVDAYPERGSIPSQSVMVSLRRALLGSFAVSWSHACFSAQCGPERHVGSRCLSPSMLAELYKCNCQSNGQTPDKNVEYARHLAQCHFRQWFLKHKLGELIDVSGSSCNTYFTLYFFFTDFKKNEVSQYGCTFLTGAVSCFFY